MRQMQGLTVLLPLDFSYCAAQHLFCLPKPVVKVEILNSNMQSIGWVKKCNQDETTTI